MQNYGEKVYQHHPLVMIVALMTNAAKVEEKASAHSGVCYKTIEKTIMTIEED